METLTKLLIDAIFDIDQAIGKIEIMLARIDKNPDHAAPGTFDSLAKKNQQLINLANALEKFRKRVL